MSFTSELVQAGVKHIGKKAAKFLNKMPVDDIAGTVRAVNRHPNEFADMMKHVNNYADKGDQSGILPYVQYQNKWKNEGVEDLRNSQTLTHGVNKGSANQEKLYPQYTRPDAIENLQAAGADKLTGRKMTPRTIQGPVPPQLADKTFDQGAKSYEEAVMLGTTKFEEDGVAKQIRNYGSDTAPHGRVTEVDVRKMSGRGTEARITYEKLLTLDEKAKGFYSVKIKGHEHAHHWNPIGVMKRVVEGLDDKTRNQLISEAQNEFGLYSGNTMFNLRQLPTKVHDKLHKALNKAGYDPKKMQSFAKADYATRKEYLKAFSKVLNDLDQQVFGEVMVEKHGPNWISQFQGLQVE